MKYLIAILVCLLVIETGILISVISNLEPGQDIILSGRTSQIFNEDGDYILPQGLGKYLGSDSVRLFLVYSEDINVEDATGSTLTIGNADASNNSGCLVLGDGSATGTKVYITATGETITATTVQPSICK